MACKQSLGVFEGDWVSLHNVYMSWKTYSRDERDYTSRYMLNTSALFRAQKIRNQLEEFVKQKLLQKPNVMARVQKAQ